MCSGIIGEASIEGAPITENEVKNYCRSGYTFIMERFLPELRTPVLCFRLPYRLVSAPS